jgi:hypothetical protein
MMDFMFIDVLFGTYHSPDFSFVVQSLLTFVFAGGLCCLIQHFMQKRYKTIDLREG